MRVNVLRGSSYLARASAIAAVVFWSLTLVVTPSPAQSVIAAGGAEWLAAGPTTMECKDFPYTVTGPGYLQIFYQMSPYYKVEGSSNLECFYFDYGGWKKTRWEYLADGAVIDVPARPASGSVNSYSYFEEYEIEAGKTYKGVFQLRSPELCNRAGQCGRRQAVQKLKVLFASSPSSGPIEMEGNKPNSTGQTGDAEASIIGSWSVGAIVNGQNQAPHPVPWVFRRDGTVEAPGYWSGTWKQSGDTVVMKMRYQGVSSTFTIKVRAGRFIASENGVPIRHGALK